MANSHQRRTQRRASGLQPQPFGEKLWLFANSQVLWGGVALVLTAIALLVPGAIVAVVLLCFAWVLFSATVWKHHFFEKWSSKTQAVGNLSIALVLGVILGVLWLWLRPNISGAPRNIPPGISSPYPSPLPTATAPQPLPASTPLPTITSKASITPTPATVTTPKAIVSPSPSPLASPTPTQQQEIILGTLMDLQSTHERVTYKMLTDAVEAIRFHDIREVSLNAEVHDLRRQGILTWGNQGPAYLGPDDVMEINPEWLKRNKPKRPR